MRSSLASVVVLALAHPSAAGAAPPDEPPRPTPYDRGRISLNASLGSQRSFHETYIVVGGRVGYYVLPGFEVAFGGMKLFGDGPSVAMVSPEVRYVLYPVDWSVRPFAGAFYHHWFIGGAFEDYDTVGGTLGVLWSQGSGFYLGIGATVERVVSSCDEAAGDDCTMIYPALILGLSI